MAFRPLLPYCGGRRMLLGRLNAAPICAARKTAPQAAPRFEASRRIADCKEPPVIRTELPSVRLTRRALLLGAASAFVLAQAGFAPQAEAQRRNGPTEVPVDELMKTVDGLPDMVIGPADAKVTIVEYASMTCGHCAAFHKSVFPELKKKYIEPGKVRFIMREFPLDNLAAAAAMLARCTGPDKSYALVETLFATQADWAYVQGNPVPKLFEIAKQAGFTQESFEKCLTDQKLLDQVNAQRAKAADQFGISATPSFFINGKKLQGGPTLAAFEEMIDPLLK